MNLKILLDDALKARNLGNLKGSLDIYKKILKKKPNNEEALINSGVINIHFGLFTEAEKLFNIAYLHNKLSFSAIKNLILINLQLKNQQKVLDILEESKKIISEIFYFENKIRALKIDHKHNFLKIEKLINEALKKYPEEIIFLNFKGLQANIARDYKTAYEYFLKLVDLDQNSYEGNYNLGITLNNLGKPNEAIAYLHKSISINDRNSGPWLAIGFSYRKINKFKESEDCLNKALSLSPDDPNIYYNLTQLMEDTDKLEDVKEYHKKALKINPNYHLSNFALGISYLKEQNWNQGFDLWRWRLKRIDSEYDLGAIVDDSEIANINFEDKIDIVAEGGIGDEILLGRMLSLVNQKYHSNITTYLDNRIKSIFSYNFPQIKFKEKKEFEVNTNKIQINLGTLPFFLKDQFKEKHSIKKLEPCPDKVSLLKKEIKKYKNQNKKIVGIAWKSKHHLWGRKKSIDLIKNKSLLENEKIIFINLQYGDCSNELKKINSKDNKLLQQTSVDLFNDLESLYALINEMDMIVTTSNVTAHIAGSLGKKTILLLPKGNARIWYWGYAEKKSYWYPSIEIIEQDNVLSWEQSIKELKNRLKIYTHLN